MPLPRRARIVVSTLLLLPWLPLRSAASPADPDTSRRIVRTIEETLVRAERLDVLSGETRLRLTREELRSLPVDGLAPALALQPGVVVDGDDIHVRGARPGEIVFEMDGVSLNEPMRGTPPDLPLIGFESVDLVTGGLSPEHGGGLAGTLVLRPVAPGPRWNARTRWQTDARTGQSYDRGGVALSGPLAGGLGLALAGEATLDDGGLPNLRTTQRRDVLGRSIGWRADNRMTAMARLATVNRPGPFAVQGFVSRRVERPYHPMFSLVGYTTPCADDSCLEGPSYSQTPGPGLRFEPYNAADHAGITETRRAGVVASAEHAGRVDRVRASLAWNHQRRIASLDGTDDTSYLTTLRAPMFGLAEDPLSDPFLVYGGDNPYFRDAEARWLEGRIEWKRDRGATGNLGGGLGVTHQHVRLRELDLAQVPTSFDSLRTYDASAPGAYGWLAGRWVTPGLIADAGLRAEWFTAGDGAASMPRDGEVRDAWAFSPRLGLVFPLSDHHAVQVSYVRIEQAPPRDFLYDQRTARVDPRHPQGNAALVPATSVSYEASLRLRNGERAWARASLFYRDLYSQVSARTVPGLRAGEFRMRYGSEDAGRAQGFELALGGVPRERTALDLTYTWMQAEGSQSFEDGAPIYPLRVGQPIAVSERPLAWDQRHRVAVVARWSGERASVAWSTQAGSGLPWTPAQRRTAPADYSQVNARRLDWTERTDVSCRLRGHSWLRAVSIGLDVRNLFDFRGARRATLPGDPHPVINTQYDDYGAYRTETGRGAGWWEDIDDDFLPGWHPVRDPRLDLPKRSVRLVIETEW